MVAWVAPAIAAGAQLLGGAMQGKSSGKKVAREQIRAQREFAQHGIRWRVEDAKAAGIHPLAALGASTPSYTPVSVGDTGNPMGQAIANAGQDISRAMQAGASERERRAANNRIALGQAMQQRRDAITFQLDVEGRKLDNQYRAIQIKKALRDVNGTAKPVPLASDAVDPVGSVDVRPSEVISHDPGNRSLEAGVTPGMKRHRIGGERTGVDLPIPTSNAELMEGTGTFYQIYDAGSRLFDRRMYGSGVPKPKMNLPRTHYWKWNVWSGQWEAKRR